MLYFFFFLTEYFDGGTGTHTFNDTIMKTIQFILSLLVGLCAAGMLYGAVVTYSPMKNVSVTITGIICIGCAALLRITYKEMK